MVSPELDDQNSNRRSGARCGDGLGVRLASQLDPGAE